MLFLTLIRLGLGYAFLATGTFMTVEIMCSDKIKPLLFPNNRAIYYLLQFTWGAISNIMGLIVAVAFRSIGYEWYWSHWNLCINLPTVKGFSLGIFSFVPMKNPEEIPNVFGQSIATAIFGPLTLGVIRIPCLFGKLINSKMENKGIVASEDEESWLERMLELTGERWMNQKK